MEKAGQPINTVFNSISKRLRLGRIPPKHLKPLSIYSRMVTEDKDSNVLRLSTKSSTRLSKLEGEAVSRLGSQSKLVSFLDEAYETPDGTRANPAKRPDSPSAVSPDLGCVLDVVSPTTLSQPSHFPELSTFRGKFKDSAADVKSPLDFAVRSEASSPSTVSSGGEKARTAPNSVCSSSEGCELSPVVVNKDSVFDFDVESILCLSPICCEVASSAAAAESVVSCKCQRGNGPHDGRVISLVQSAWPGQGADEERVRWLSDGDEGSVGSSSKNGEEYDAGYSSSSYLQPHIAAGDRSQSPPGAPLLSLATSIGERGVLDAGDALSPPEPVYINHAAVCPQQTRAKVDAPLLSSNGATLFREEDDAREVWTIGSPLLESSVCRTPIKSIKVKCGEVGEAALRSVQERRVSFDGEEITVEVSYETTLPLQVQVKSVVVVPKPPSPEPKHTVVKPFSGGYKTTASEAPITSKRPVVLEREDWQRKKRLYMDSVNRHMKENPDAVMNELFDLMSHVAEGQGTCNRKWQHPTDLTRRNYQRRFGNTTPLMSLGDWQTLNCRRYPRFANVPKFFERSPLP